MMVNATVLSANFRRDLHRILKTPISDSGLPRSQARYFFIRFLYTYYSTKLQKDMLCHALVW